MKPPLPVKKSADTAIQKALTARELTRMLGSRTSNWWGTRRSTTRLPRISPLRSTSTQIASDLSKLAQSGALEEPDAGRDGNTESTKVGSSTSVTLTAQQQAQQIGSNLTSSVQGLTLDLWVTKDTIQIRQIRVKASYQAASRYRPKRDHDLGKHWHHRVGGPDGHPRGAKVASSRASRASLSMPPCLSLQQPPL